MAFAVFAASSCRSPGIGEGGGSPRGAFLEDYGAFLRDRERLRAALPSERVVPVAVMGATVALLQVNGADRHVQNAIGGDRRPRRSPVTSDYELFGLYAGAALLPAVARPSGGLPAYWPYGLTTLETSVWTYGIVKGLRALEVRDRPSGAPGGFPSGHAAHAFAAATLLDIEYGHEVGIPAYLVAGLVGYQRVRRGFHYPGDVLAGAAIGTLVATAIHGKNLGTGGYHRRRFDVAAVPVIGPGGAGVALTFRW